MALVALRHRKYDEARTLLEAAVAKDRSNLAAWRALVWLNMFTGKSDSSLKQMSALAKQYPKVKARAEVGQPLRDSARWMGQLLGFLEGPGKEGVAVETVATYRKAISDELTGQWRQAFDGGRQQVLGQYSQLQGELDAAQKKALAEEEQQKAADLKSIEQDRVRAASRPGYRQYIHPQTRRYGDQLSGHLTRPQRPAAETQGDGCIAGQERAPPETTRHGPHRQDERFVK